MHPFSTPWKHQKSLQFSGVFRGWRKGEFSNYAKKRSGLTQGTLSQKTGSLIPGEWTITNHALIGRGHLTRSLSYFTTPVSKAGQNFAFICHTFCHMIRFSTFFLKYGIMTIELPRHIYWILIKIILKMYKRFTKIRMGKTKVTFFIRLQRS